MFGVTSVPHQIFGVTFVSRRFFGVTFCHAKIWRGVTPMDLQCGRSLEVA